MLLESSKTHTSARAPGAAPVPYTDQSRQCSVSFRCVSLPSLNTAALEFQWGTCVPGPVLSPVCAGQCAPVFKQFGVIPGGLFLLCSKTDWKREPAKAIISSGDGTEMRTLVLPAALCSGALTLWGPGAYCLLQPPFFLKRWPRILLWAQLSMTTLSSLEIHPPPPSLRWSVEKEPVHSSVHSFTAYIYLYHLFCLGM